VTTSLLLSTSRASSGSVPFVDRRCISRAVLEECGDDKEAQVKSAVLLSLSWCMTVRHLMSVTYAETFHLIYSPVRPSPKVHRGHVARRASKSFELKMC
jgi:hypothetical protein